MIFYDVTNYQGVTNAQDLDISCACPLCRSRKNFPTLKELESFGKIFKIHSHSL